MGVGVTVALIRGQVVLVVLVVSVVSVVLVVSAGCDFRSLRDLNTLFFYDRNISIVWGLRLRIWRNWKLAIE